MDWLHANDEDYELGTRRMFGMIIWAVLLLWFFRNFLGWL